MNNKEFQERKSKFSISKIFSNESAPIFLVFILLVIVIGILQPRFFSPMNIKNVLMQISITGVLALGMSFVMISGGIDLSVGWMTSFLGCFMAWLITGSESGVPEYRGIPMFVIVIIIIATAMLSSALMGFIISRTKIEPFIISLGFMSVYQGFTFLLSRGSERNIGVAFSFIGSTFPLGIGMPIYIFISLAIILGLILKFTKFGKRNYAVGCNSEAAFLAGINVKNFKLSIYMLNGFLVSIAAMTLTSRLHSGNPLMGSGKEIDAIAAVVVGGTALSGGKGSIPGTVIGVLLLGIISNGMNIIGVNPYWQYVFKGIVIVVAVLLSYYSGLRANNNMLISKS